MSFYTILFRYGNGAGWVLHSPSPYPIIIYLFVILPIPNGDEKLNSIPVPDGYEYPRIEWFLIIKNISFFATLREML